MLIYIALEFILILLKIINVISWGWIWVLCPMWLGAVYEIFMMVYNFIHKNKN